jgi:hypothetical protein
MATWWGASRPAPISVKLTHVNVVFQKPVAALSASGETKLARASGVRFDVMPEVTIDAFREQMIAHFGISPRKSVTIRWWGSALEDGRNFGSYRVSDGSQLEVTLNSLSVTQIDELAKRIPLSRVRVQTFTGRRVTVENVSASTTPRQLKQTLVESKQLEGLGKANADAAVLFFSAAIAPATPGMLPALSPDEPIGARPCAAAKVRSQTTREYRSPAPCLWPAVRCGSSLTRAPRLCPSLCAWLCPCIRASVFCARAGSAGVIDNDMLFIKYAPIVKDDKKKR